MRTHVTNINGRNCNKHEYRGLTRSIRRCLSNTEFHHTLHRSDMIEMVIDEGMQIQRGPEFIVEQRMKIIRIHPDADPSQQEAFPVQDDKKIRAQMLSPRRGVSKEMKKSSTKPVDLLGRSKGKNVHLTRVSNLVRDRIGNFYEIRGGQSRRLGYLVMDEQARVFEVCPTNKNLGSETMVHVSSGHSLEADKAKSPHVAAENKKVETKHKNACDVEKHHSQSVNKQPETQNQTKSYSKLKSRAEYKFEKGLDFRQPVEKDSNTEQPQKQQGYRKIFADNGIRLDVQFGKVKNEVAPHMRNPEKLNEKDLIDIYLQIYECLWTIPVADIAAIELGNSKSHRFFRPFTQRKSQMLGLHHLYKPTRHAIDKQNCARKVHAGQRLYRLWPVFDPTSTDNVDQLANRMISLEDSGSLSNDRY